MRKLTAHNVLRVVASCAVAALLFVACKGEEIPTLPPDDTMDDDAGSGNQPNNMEDDSGSPDIRCLMPRPGCECEPEGASYDCRAYYYVNEGEPSEYVACSYGHYYCVDGEWGECIGERIVVVPPSEIPPGTLISSEGPPQQSSGDAGP